MMRSKTIVISPVGADTDGIAQSQTPGAAGNLTLNGTFVVDGVATITQPARVTITSAGNDSGRVFTITGTDRYGRPATETVTGANAGAATSLKSFATITQVAVDDATAGAVTVGNDGDVESQWIPWDARANEWSIQGVLSAGANLTWSIEHTNNDVQLNGFSEEDADTSPDANLTNETASQLGEIGFPVVASRVAITNFTSGTLTLHIREAGI